MRKYKVYNKRTGTVHNENADTPKEAAAKVLAEEVKAQYRLCDVTGFFVSEVEQDSCDYVVTLLESRYKSKKFYRSRVMLKGRLME